MKHAATLAALILAAHAGFGQQSRIVAVTSDGWMTWTNAVTGVVCAVEWTADRPHILTYNIWV